MGLLSNLENKGDDASSTVSSIMSSATPTPTASSSAGGLLSHLDGSATSTTSSATSSSTGGIKGFFESKLTKMGSCPELPQPVFVKGSAHTGMLYFGIACAVITTIAMLFLIITHLARYSRPREQRQIVKMAFMPIVMAVCCAAALVGYAEAAYIQPLAELYDALALPAFFLLLVQFTVPDGEFGPDLFEKMYARAVPLKSGEDPKWTRTVWVAVFQCPIVLTVSMIVQEASTAAGTFCAGSMSPKFGNFWSQILRDVSLVVCVVAIYKFIKRLRHVMHVQRPMAKLVVFKLIIAVPFTIQVRPTPIPDLFTKNTL